MSKLAIRNATANGTLAATPGTFVAVWPFRVFVCGKCGRQYWLPTDLNPMFVPRHECGTGVQS